MSSSKVSVNDIYNMVNHWLRTPINGYLGSDYGQNLNDLLQKPLSQPDADRVIHKLKNDIPILQALEREYPNVVNLYSYSEGVDKLRIILEVLGKKIDVTDVPKRIEGLGNNAD